MTSDGDLVTEIVAGRSTGLLAADDPPAVAAILDDDPAITIVAADELGAAVAAARVRLAEVVVDRARRQAVPEAIPDVAGAPAVQAAEAHLRRALAAWKLHWWERDGPVPDLAAWSGRLPGGVPLTLVAVDPDRQVDDAAVATMRATAPAAVRVVVLQAGSESSRRRGDPEARFGAAAKPPTGSRGGVTDLHDP